MRAPGQFFSDLPGVFDSLAPFDLDLDVGLFFIALMRAGSGKPPWAPERIIKSESYSNAVYGPMRTPGPEDYYTCPSCGEQHLRPCFQQEAPVLGMEHFIRYFVELSPRGGYARIHVPTASLVQIKGGLQLPELTWVNNQGWPWQVSGVFYMHKDKLFAYEVLGRELKAIGKGSTIKLTPRMGNF